MNHELYKSWLHLLALDELEPADREALDVHLAGCTECRSELEQLRKFRDAVAGQRFTITDSLLQEARQELRAVLRIERSRVPFWSGIMARVDDVLAPWAKVSVAGAAMVTTGFFAGYLAFSGDPSAGGGIALKEAGDGTDIIRGEARITNVRFDDPDASDGEIEFSFDAVSPVRVKGSPNDPGIQSVLTRALITEENPGVRLRTVSAITSQIQINTGAPDEADNDVKRALVDAMKYDDNPGVRKEALRALAKFPFDELIKEGLLYVLSKDKSEGLRVDAINSLGAVRSQITASDDRLLDILQKRVEFDNNRYVRTRARAVLEEVKQQ
ncbi:MAG: HEAT repeat domain-containing protein [Bacteroidota bacterium]